MILHENLNTSHIGVYILGKGFIVTDEQAGQLIAAGTSDVVARYLTGEDVNETVDQAPNSWVIDFGHMSESQSSRYTPAFHHVLLNVKPERDQVRRPAYRTKWWQFADKKAGPRAILSTLNHCLVIRQSSNTLMPVRVPTGNVLDKTLVIFATESYGQQAILSASPHTLWAIQQGPVTQGQGRRYTPTDVFESFPRPDESEMLIGLGERLETRRREIMGRRRFTLDQLYSQVNNPDLAASSDFDVASIRELHIEIDRSCLETYGWNDIELKHGFYSYKNKTRWTVCPAARVEILDRLLEENHRRAALQGEAPPPAEEADEDVDA